MGIYENDSKIIPTHLMKKDALHKFQYSEQHDATKSHLHKEPSTS